MIVVAKKVKAKMIDKGFSVRKLAEASGLNETNVQKIVKNDKSVQIKTVSLLSKALDCPAKDILVNGEI